MSKIVYVIGLFLSTQVLMSDSITPVMKHNLSIYPWEDEDWPNEPYGDFLNRCMKYQNEMQAFKKYRIAWAIIERHWNDKKHDASILHNDYLTWRNLQLLCSEDEDNVSCCVAQIVDRTSTAMGRVMLSAWIAQPIDNYDELERRQSCVRFLLEHDFLFNALDMYLADLKKSENLFLSFWGNDPLKQASNKNYFTISRAPRIENALNNSASVLTGSVIFEHQKRIIGVVTTALATAILPLYGIMHALPDGYNSDIALLAERLIGSGGPVFGLLSLMNNRFVQSTGSVLAGFSCGLQLQEQFDWMYDNFTLNMYLQKKLCHVAHFLHTIENISDLMMHHSGTSFADNLPFHELISQTQKASCDVQQLYELLKTRTFTSKPSFVADYGKILLTYRLMNACTIHLERLLCLIGELDAYMSIARLYKEHESKRVHYSFVEYHIDVQQPSIIAHDLWGLFIDQSHVVPNSIEIGFDDDRHNVIITGPNEGGKSTFVKALTIALILGQSIGIVPADYMRITPFSYIATYLNITDDHGKSLFEAQVQRIKHIIDHIDNMSSDELSFVIIDELFNGTDARVGQATSYSVARYLSNKSNVISIFPTHFPELVLLEEGGKSINYSVSASINEDNEISYPFVLEKGSSSQNIVFDILRNEGFHDDIINDAMKKVQV